MHRIGKAGLHLVAFATLVGCAVSAETQTEAESQSDPISQTTGSCGANPANVVGTGQKERDRVVVQCPITDQTCQQRALQWYSGFTCPYPAQSVNDAQKDAIASCDSRLGSALAAIGCPSSCPRASSGGTCIADMPSAGSFLQSGGYSPGWWAMWCHELAAVTARGNGNVTCSSSCGDGGDAGDSGDGGCADSGRD